MQMSPLPRMVSFTTPPPESLQPTQRIILPEQDNMRRLELEAYLSTILTKLGHEEDQSSKNLKLYTRLLELESKTVTEVATWCKHELTLVAAVVAAAGNLTFACEQLFGLNEPADRAANLIILFKNRHAGCRQQPLTRCGAKYLQILAKILHCLPLGAESKKVSPSVQHQLSKACALMKLWKNMWLKSYTHYVNADYLRNNLVLTLGSPGGSLGFRHFSLSLNLISSPEVLKPSPYSSDSNQSDFEEHKS